MPSSISTVVVLPAPFGPSKPNTSPSGTAKLTPPQRLHSTVIFEEVIDQDNRFGHSASPCRIYRILLSQSRLQRESALSMADGLTALASGGRLSFRNPGVAVHIDSSADQGDSLSFNQPPLQACVWLAD